MNNRLESLAVYAPTVVRVGISLVFLWFGSSQLADTQSWLGWLPAWTSALPVTGATLVQLNGVFEIVFGVLLLLGFYTRIVSGLLALHLLQIVCTVGYNAIGARDFGLFLAAVSIFLHGPDRYTLDARIARRRSGGQPV